MKREIVLNNLQKRNNLLKSQLIHDQLKHGNYSFGYYRKYSLIVLEEYRKHRSFFKASQAVGISQEEMMNWYIQGQRGNTEFRGFYLAVNDINNEKEEIFQTNSKDAEELNDNVMDEGNYVISPYGDGWSYKTYVDGEKIFIISNELETLKKKVKSKHLPLD
jgi:hypothetical protein